MASPSGLSVRYALEYEALLVFPKNEQYFRSPGAKPSEKYALWKNFIKNLKNQLEKSNIEELYAKHVDQDKPDVNIQRFIKEDMVYYGQVAPEGKIHALLALAEELRSRGLPVSFKTDLGILKNFDLPLLAPSQPPEHGLARHFIVKTDSTVVGRSANLYNAGPDGSSDTVSMETTTPVFNEAIGSVGNNDQLRTLCAIFNDDRLRFRTWTNESCGLHVHLSPGDAPLDLPTAQRVVALVYVCEPALQALADREQRGRPGNKHHEPLSDAVFALAPYRGDGTAHPLLPVEKDAGDVFRLARLKAVFATTTWGQLNALLRNAATREFSAVAVKHTDGAEHYYSPTLEFRLFSPSVALAYSRHCVRLAANFFRVACLDDAGYREKLALAVERVARRPENWEALLEVLDLGDDRTFWTNPGTQYWDDNDYPVKKQVRQTA
ncbi:hypothetical protein F4780DRAFT_786564 [Xylariomycetidae sp. FL0641]|nr:hypothetical protein F4780DRAFT_786564 [Xylariomycetidae sp. FL0641]